MFVFLERRQQWVTLWTLSEFICDVKMRTARCSSDKFLVVFFFKRGNVSCFFCRVQYFISVSPYVLGSVYISLVVIEKIIWIIQQLHLQGLRTITA